MQIFEILASDFTHTASLTTSYEFTDSTQCVDRRIRSAYSSLASVYNIKSVYSQCFEAIVIHHCKRVLITTCNNIFTSTSHLQKPLTMPEYALPSSSSKIPFSHSAAGHEGITTDATGSLIIKPCTRAEIDFYESARSHPDFAAHMPVYMGSLKLSDDTAAQGLVEEVARGQSTGTGEAVIEEAVEVRKREEENTGEKGWAPSGGAKLSSDLAIVMGNATAGFKCPNILDLKLGARLWDDDAPTAKRAKLDEVANSSTSSTLGFRIAGMKVWIGDGTIATAGLSEGTVGERLKEVSDPVMQEVNTKLVGGYKIFDKFYGRNNIQTENASSGFEEFLSSTRLPSKRTGASGEERRYTVLKRLQREIESIQYILEKEEMRMYSASVLMVYEGDVDALEEALQLEKETQPEANDEEDDESDEDEKHKVHEVVLIDFAHAHWTPGQGPDENTLQGVRSIKKILDEMISR